MNVFIIQNLFFTSNINMTRTSYKTCIIHSFMQSFAIYQNLHRSVEAYAGQHRSTDVAVRDRAQQLAIVRDNERDPLLTDINGQNCISNRRRGLHDRK